MVFFTCNLCGDSVKKPAVEKHYNTKCRGAVKNVSCMDCMKDFHGEEFAAHTKCITEAEKYSGKNYVPKEQSGAKKQEDWMDIVRSILETREYNLTAQVRNAFQKLQNMDNVPRKKAKFQNYASSCLRLSKPLAVEVWVVLEKELEKMKQLRMEEAEAKKTKKEDEKELKEDVLQNGEKRAATEENGHEAPAKKKSKKHSESAVVEAPQQNGDAEATVEVDEAFDWSATLEKLVAKHAEGILVEKLKKKMLKKYTSKLGVDAITEKQQKKFEKKFAKHLKKSPAVQVEGEVAKTC